MRVTIASTEESNFRKIIFVYIKLVPSIKVTVDKVFLQNAVRVIIKI